MPGRPSEPSPQDHAGDRGKRTEDEVFEEYVERINGGEDLDRDQIRRLHPEYAERLIAELDLYEGITEEPLHANPLGTLGDYTLRRQVGRGGMGVVYEAWENSMDRRVALKVLPAGIAADDKAVTRFVREARLAGKLNHPNVVGVYGMGVNEQTPYYAMEFVEGETLAQVLAKLKAADPEEETLFGKKDSVVYFGKLSEAFADVADGLQHAHSKGIIHRDIKPSNLILDRDGRLRILDFGLARLEGQDSLTLSGDFLGTPQYMSPEQARRKRIPVDHRTDVYSLGATMYEALCGTPPFRGRDHADTLSQIIERDPSPPSRLNPRVPPDLATITMKCLRKDATDRYGTAEALGQDIRRFLRKDPIEARPQPAWERVARRVWKRKVRVGLALLVALLLFPAGLMIRNHRLDLRRANEAKVRAAVMKLHLGESLRTVPGQLGFMEMSPSQVDYAEAALVELGEAAAALHRAPAIHYHRARGYVALGRHDDALRELNLALGIDPRFAPARKLRAARLQAQVDHVEDPARERKAEEPAGEPWEAAWLEAQDALEKKNWEDAAAAFGKLLDLAKDGGEAYLGSSVEALLGRGLAHLAAKDYLLAVLDFQIAEVLWPESIEPTLLKGKAYVLLGRKDLLEEDLERLFARARDPAEVASSACNLYEHLKDHEKALAWAERPVTAVSPEMQAWRQAQRAYFLSHLGRQEESERVVVEGIRRFPGSALLRCVAGVILVRHSKFADAERHFQEAKVLDPQLIYAYANLGFVRRIQGKDAEAIEAYRGALKINPTFEGAYIGLGQTLAYQGNFDDAARICGQAIEVRPDSFEARAALAEILALQGKLDDGIAAVRKAIAVEPENPSGHYTLAQWLSWKGEFEEAATEYSRTIELNPSFSSSYRDLHGVLFRLLRRPGISTGLRSQIDDLKRVLEVASRSAADDPYFLSTSALARAFGANASEIEGALELSAKAVEASARRDPGLLVASAHLESLRGRPGEAVVILEEALLLPHAKRGLLGLLKEYRQAALPVFASYASIDAALAGAGPEKGRQLLEEFRTTGRDEKSEPLLVYMEGRLLQLEGRRRDAAERFSESAALGAGRGAPLRRRAESLQAVGEVAMAEGELRVALEGLALTDRKSWHLWLTLSFVDLRRAPAQVLAAFPGTAPEGYGADLRWLLERLAAGEPIRIHCGGEGYSSPSGQVWGRDRFYLGGYRYREDFPNPEPSTEEIAGTEDDPLYQTERFFRDDEVEGAGYRIPLPPGRYRVTVHFAEIWFRKSGSRVFDVRVEGKEGLKDYEPLSSGFATADRRPLEVLVEDGLLDLDFVTKVQNPKVAAIEIERVE